jgi:hypothetical protein
LIVTTDPASPGTGEDGPQPQASDLAGHGDAGEMPGSPGGADRDEEEVDVLYLAGQRPALPPGEWLLITAVDGAPGAEFLTRVLPPGGRHAHGGDVLAHLAAEPDGGEPPAVRASVWAVLSGLLVPIAAWDRHDPDGWPERIRATTAFAMGMVTELEEHGADLGPGHRVHLDDAVVTATAGIPLGTTSPTAQAGLSPGR